MFASAWALRCLLTFSVVVAGLSCMRAADDLLVVYVGVEPGQPTAPLEQMQRELKALMRQTGVRVEWKDIRNRQAADDATLVAVAELNGVCGLGVDTRAIISASPYPSGLASSSVSDGSVLPFISIYCGALNRFIAQPLARESRARQDYLYGRAMARLLAHELYHYLAQTQHHAHGGIAKPCFSVRDLLAARFEFEESALNKIRHRPGYIRDRKLRAGVNPQSTVRPAVGTGFHD